jgi:hypothetical protein
MNSKDRFNKWKKYQVLKKKLGDVSTSELVDTYMSDREYWDSLGRLK